jgi:tight adherence protein B
MDYLYYLFIVFAFIAVVLLLEGIYLMWNTYKGPNSGRIESRLQAISAGWHGSNESTNIYKRRLLSDSPKLERLLMQVPRIHHLDRFLVQSGLELSVSMYAGYTCMAFLGGFSIASLLNLTFLISLLCAFSAGTLPTIFIFNAKKKRLLKIEEQLPDAIDLISRALKAGHAFSSALEMVATEGTEPLSSEFRITYDEVNYGISMQDALMNLSYRVPSMDLRYMVIAIIIQRESGGNLAELLEKISSLIRARLKLFGTIRVLSAEGRLSAWILGCLPFVMALLIYLINTEYMSLLFTDPMGLKMVYISLSMMIIGIFIMSRIIKIRF